MIRALESIRHNKVFYKKGALLEGLAEGDASRLVKLGSAEYIVTPEEELAIQTAKSSKVQEIDPALFEELRGTLDEEFNAEELMREAKSVGVDLMGATTKKAVIEAIIQQGKAELLLEDDPDDV